MCNIDPKKIMEAIRLLNALPDDHLLADSMADTMRNLQWQRRVFMHLTEYVP